VKLAGGSTALRAVGTTVDDHTAHAADALTAVMIKGYGVLPRGDEALVHNVHHLQKRGVVGDASGFYVLEVPCGFSTGLTPYFEMKIENRHVKVSII
jgi:hypothetical protein